jgi:hypothetical protein
VQLGDMGFSFLAALAALRACSRRFATFARFCPREGFGIRGLKSKTLRDRSGARGLAKAD